MKTKGRIIDERIYERQNVSADLLGMIGGSKDVAIEDACRVEHYISEETFDALRKFHKKKEKK